MGIQFLIHPLEEPIVMKVKEASLTRLVVVQVPSDENDNHVIYRGNRQAPLYL